MDGKRFILTWAYLVEVILACTIYGTLVILVEPAKAGEFILGTAGLWAAVTGVFMGLSAALFAVVVQILSGEFGEWLQSRNHAESIYKWAYAHAMLVFLATTAALVTAGFVKSHILAQVALVLLIYSVVNVVGMLKTTIELSKLSITFRTLVRNERRRLEREASEVETENLDPPES